MDDVLIIGAGPAGIAAAIQLKRYGLEPHLVERSSIGGLLRNANLVENYPGFPGGIPGPQFVRLLDQHVSDLRLRLTYGEVTSLDIAEGVFRAETSAGEICAQVVVIASGTQPRPLVFSNLPAAVSERIFYEVHPLASLAGKIFVILGAGDAAFDYALNLAKNNRVLLLNRGSETKCLPLLWERARINPSIEYYAGVSLDRIEAGNSAGLIIEYSCAGATRVSECEALLVAYGRDPQLDFLSSRLQDLAGTLEAQGKLYFVGDVKNGIYRQTSIAVGDGILAAMKIYQQGSSRS
jgi:thioredoxin reductase (NADPH)